MFKEVQRGRPPLLLGPQDTWRGLGKGSVMTAAEYSFAGVSDMLAIVPREYSSRFFSFGETFGCEARGAQPAGGTDARQSITCFRIRVWTRCIGTGGVCHDRS